MANEPIRITPPLTDADARGASKPGIRVLITGTIYTARDSAHKRLLALIEKGEELPFDFKGQFIYYVGPTPPKPGKVYRERRAYDERQDGRLRAETFRPGSKRYDRQGAALGRGARFSKEEQGGLYGGCRRRGGINRQKHQRRPR